MTRGRPLQRRNEASVGTAVMVILAFLCCIGGKTVQSFWNEHEVTCTVTKTDRTSARNGRSSARVYTKQCGVLSNEDSLLHGKHRSADIQGQLQDGHTYRLRVAGWRFGPTSDFPNILEVLGEAPQ